MEQLELLPVVAQAAPERPRCRMCALPAWWLQRAQTWGTYCGSTNCRNRERLCQCCGATFTIGIDGAGTKYCSRDCKVAGYRPDRHATRPTPCTWCGKEPPSGSHTRGGKWPYICAECTDPIRHVVPRLKAHNVPHERAQRLLTDPGCEVCGSNVLEKIRGNNGRGKTFAALVVDHDHSCCPGDSFSCGRCVRGLLCYFCNWAAGQLKDSPDNARALAAYLDRWKGAA